MKISVAITICLFTFSICDIGFGRCKVKPSEGQKVVTNFNLESYLGKWYEQFRAKDVPFQKGECTTAVYTKGENKVIVNNSELIEGSTERKIALGEAVQLVEGEGRLKVSFGPSFISKFTGANYNVFQTDYTNYAIVYSCTEFFSIYHVEFVWVLTREISPSTQTLELINLGLNELGYPRELIRQQTKQGGNCLY